MVLENLLPEKWLEKRPTYAFVLGLTYSIIAIGLSVILFPRDPALVAVAFTSLLLLPSLYKLFGKEEKREGKERRFNLARLWKDNRNLIVLYIFLFLGILFSYSFFAIVLPSMATNALFEEQLQIMQGQTGQANAAKTVFTATLFTSIFTNNLKVMIFCFLLSLLVGNGAVFLITWNASVWGTIFGNLAKTAASYTGAHPFFYFLEIMACVSPHMILEALAYILAAIAGSVLSRDFLKEKIESYNFTQIVLCNFVLLAIALIVLILAAAVETYVLGNVGLYKDIIMHAFV